MNESFGSEIETMSSESVLGLEDILERLKGVEKRLAELEALQKQDADEMIGAQGTLNEAVEGLEAAVEKLEDDVEHHSHLLSRYRVADHFGK